MPFRRHLYGNMFKSWYILLHQAECFVVYCYIMFACIAIWSRWAMTYGLLFWIKAMMVCLSTRSFFGNALIRQLTCAEYWIDMLKNCAEYWIDMLKIVQNTGLICWNLCRILDWYAETCAEYWFDMLKLVLDTGFICWNMCRLLDWYAETCAEYWIDMLKLVQNNGLICWKIKLERSRPA